MDGELSPAHWLVVLVVVILFFGAKRLPDLARSSGRSLRIFRSELKGMGDDAPTEHHDVAARAAAAEIARRRSAEEQQT